MLEALLGDKTKLSVGAAEDFRIPHGLIFSTKFPFFTDVLHSPPLFPLLSYSTGSLDLNCYKCYGDIFFVLFEKDGLSKYISGDKHTNIIAT